MLVKKKIYLIEDNAIYFEPDDPSSISEAISEVRKRLRSGWKPDWSDSLLKLPNDWNQVVNSFLYLINNRY